MIYNVCFFLGKENLLKTKQSQTAIDEQVHLALRWSITDTNDDQSAATTRLWNDISKVIYSI